MLNGFNNNERKLMFTFENENTPIIENGTIVNYEGKTFTIDNNVFEYFYHVQCSDGKNAMIPMTGNSASYNWKAGVDKVESIIKNW
tara:strand:- start:56 stop:313 length:258 start_codon:yes stop_codon:yes gene_type:complete